MVRRSAGGGQMHVDRVSTVAATPPPVTPRWVLTPILPRTMQSINRFIYGPTPEERVRQWQSKLRQEQRVLDREMRQVRSLCLPLRSSVDWGAVGHCYEQSEAVGEAVSHEGRCEICANIGEGSRSQ